MRSVETPSTGARSDTVAPKVSLQRFDHHSAALEVAAEMMIAFRPWVELPVDATAAGAQLRVRPAVATAKPAGRHGARHAMAMFAIGILIGIALGVYIARVHQTAAILGASVTAVGGVHPPSKNQADRLGGPSHPEGPALRLRLLTLPFALSDRTARGSAGAPHW